ncbi:hypothetical protein Tco_0435367 [Tanacetum coccineum]
MPETAIPEISTAHTTTAPPTISIITPLPQLTTPPLVPTNVPTTTSIHALLDFSSLFGFDQRVSTLERELSQLKQAEHSAQLLKSAKSQIPTIVNDLLSIRIGYAARTALQSYTKEFEKKAQEERKLYIDVVEKLSNINESLENIILAKSSSQPKSTYEAAASLIEFELKKILLDKIEKSKSYQATPEYRELYDGLVKSYNFEKDLFSSYGNISKDAEPPKGSKSKDSKTSSSKGTKSQPKSSRKSVQAKEPVFEVVDTEMPQDQGGDTKDQPNVKVTPMDDWLKKLKRPSTPDPDWNVTKFVDSRPPQKWISRIAQADKPPLTFNELMNTPIDFSAYVMHNLKIDNLT